MNRHDNIIPGVGGQVYDEDDDGFNYNNNNDNNQYHHHHGMNDDVIDDYGMVDYPNMTQQPHQQHPLPHQQYQPPVSYNNNNINYNQQQHQHQHQPYLPPAPAPTPPQHQHQRSSSPPTPSYGTSMSSTGNAQRQQHQQQQQPQRFKNPGRMQDANEEVEEEEDVSYALEEDPLFYENSRGGQIAKMQQQQLQQLRQKQNLRPVNRSATTTSAVVSKNTNTSPGVTNVGGDPGIGRVVVINEVDGDISEEGRGGDGGDGDGHNDNVGDDGVGGGGGGGGGGDDDDDPTVVTNVTGTAAHQYAMQQAALQELRDPSYLLNTLETMIPKILNYQHAARSTKGNSGFSGGGGNTGGGDGGVGGGDESSNQEQQRMQQQQQVRHNSHDEDGRKTKRQLENQQRRDQAEHVWDRIRRWLWANPYIAPGEDIPFNDSFHNSTIFAGSGPGGAGGGGGVGGVCIRTAGAYVRGTNDMTPLHLVCKLQYPPEDIIIALLQAAPDTASWTDSYGWLPLHHASANGCSSDVMAALIEAYPDGKLLQDQQKRTPLHFYATRSSHVDNPTTMSTNAMMLCERVQVADPDADASSNIILNNTENSNRSRSIHASIHQDSSNNMTSTETNTFKNSNYDSVGITAAQLTDSNGMLPIHYACAYGTHPSVLSALASAYPRGLTARERHGRAPMHLAMVNAHREESNTVVQFLLEYSNESKETINARDRQGCLPLHLLAAGLKQQQLAASGASVSSSAKHARMADDLERRSTISECLSLYLGAEPNAAADFLTAIKDLPDWLQDIAVVSKHVRTILNEKIVQRFPTSILMMDGIILVMLIVCFAITSKNHIDLRFNPDKTEDDTTGALIMSLVAATYFLLRELVQFASLMSLGNVTHWFKDPSNWLDMCVIVMVYYYGITMLTTDTTFVLVSDDAFRTGIAFTQGILWVAIIVYLKSTLVDFAVFVGGVFYVLQRLVAFLLAVGVILLAFAQMFFFVYVYTPMCDEYVVPPDDVIELPNGEYLDTSDFIGCVFPHCRFDTSLLKVYTMMMGEVGDHTRYETSLVAQILYVGFAFLVVILLSNVLIAIVQDSYEIIQNDRAAIVFWSNRLDFVAEMDVIMYAIQRRLGTTTKRPGPGDRSIYAYDGDEDDAYNHAMNTKNNNNNNNNSTDPAAGGNGTKKKDGELEHAPGGTTGSTAANVSAPGFLSRMYGGRESGVTNDSEIENPNTQSHQYASGSQAEVSERRERSGSAKMNQLPPTNHLSSSSNVIGNGGANEPKPDIFSEAWQQVMSLFDTSLYDDVDWIDAWVHNIFRIFSIVFIIPMWLILGFLSAGWLWPPQVREYLFVQRETAISRAELDRQKLSQLKAIQADLKELKLDIMREMTHDRDEMIRLKADVETIQGEVYADLLQIKELMDSLVASGNPGGDGITSPGASGNIMMMGGGRGGGRGGGGGGGVLPPGVGVPTQFTL